MKKKILHLNTNLDITSGVTRHIHLLARNLVEEYEHHFITLRSQDDWKYIFENSLVVHEIINPFHVGKMIMPFFVFYYAWKHKIDIIHSHHRYCDLISAVISWFLHSKTITTVHSKVYGKRKLSYHATTIVAVSDSIRKHLHTHFEIDNERLRVIYNFIDPDLLRCAHNRTDVRIQLGISADEILIGYAGRIDFYEKGIDLLVNAFEVLKRNFQNLRLILIGRGKDLVTVKKCNKNRNLNILIIEPTEKVFDYFQCIDLFVLPSRIDPFPYVMLEASAMKIPIVASRVNGIPEFIDNKVNGLLFEKNNLDDLISKIELMLSDETLRQDLSLRLFKKVFDEYEKSKVLPKYINLYNGKNVK